MPKQVANVPLSVHSCFRDTFQIAILIQFQGTMTGVNSLSGAHQHTSTCAVVAAAHTICRLHASRSLPSHHIFHNQARSAPHLSGVAVCIDPSFQQYEHADVICRSRNHRRHCVVAAPPAAVLASLWTSPQAQTPQK
jgi:hypothetical protein